MRWSTILFIFLFANEAESAPCAQVKKKNNVIYCDTIEPLCKLKSGEAVIYTSSNKGKRLERTVLKAKSSSNAKTKVFVNSTEKDQTIMGFVASFTDSVGMNLKTLPQSMQDQIIEQYFSEEGNCLKEDFTVLINVP